MERKSVTFAWSVLACLATIAVSGMFFVEANSLQKKGVSTRPATHRQMLLADGGFPPPQLPTQPPKKTA